MRTYQALLFDLGKVVFDLSFDRVFQYWAQASGRPVNELKAKFEFDEVFAKFEKDEISPPEFRALISRKLDITLPDYAFDTGWGALYLDPYAGIDTLLAALGQQYQLVALTNTNRLHSSIWKSKYAATLRYFQHVFSSYELKARKPEAEAYQRVLDYLHLPPQQVLFLDDSPDNIKGAAQVGLHTIWVTSYGQMVTELHAREVVKQAN